MVKLTAEGSKRNAARTDNDKLQNNAQSLH